MQGESYRLINQSKFRLLQGLVTSSLLIVLLYAVNWEHVYTLFAISQWDYIVLSIILIGISHLLNILRWAHLLRGYEVTNTTLLVYYGAGLFSNNFLPTGIGGDGVRIFLLSRHIAPTRALLSVILDRGLGTFALSALLIVALYLGLPPGTTIEGREERSFFYVEQVAYTGGLAIIGVSFIGVLSWKLFPLFRNAAAKSLAGVSELFTNVSCSWGTWWRIFSGGYVISVFSHLGIVAAHWAVVEAFNISVPVVALIWLVLIGALSLLIPLSINGIGLQESVYVVLLGCYGISSSMAFAVAITLRLLLVGFGVVGGILSLRIRIASSYE